MVEAVQWLFYGYVTPAGNQDVQAWYDGLSDDEKDEIRDTFEYLEKVPVSSWKKPEVQPLGDGLFEVRCTVNELNLVVRVYGGYWPKGRRHVFTLLSGTNKKGKPQQQKHIADARKRLAALEGAVASIHVFKF